jgi:manganese oxidase
MGHTGMDMGRMAEIMPMPPNSVPMKGAVGRFGDYISMGGMFTIIKVRDRLESYEQDPGWYHHPRGTVALKGSAADLDRDGIDVHAPTAGAVDNGPHGSVPRAGSRGRVLPTPMPGHTHR